MITRKGGKVVTIPLAPRTARAIDLATGERTEGPLFITVEGRQLDRHGAARIVRRVTRRAQIAKHVGPNVRAKSRGDEAGGRRGDGAQPSGEAGTRPHWMCSTG